MMMMKILYYEKNQRISEDRLLESLINLGLSGESIVHNLSTHALYNKAEFNLDHLKRVMEDELPSQNSGYRLIPFNRIYEYLQVDSPPGKFAAHAEKIILMLEKSRSLVSETDTDEYPAGISANSFMELLAYLNGLDALDIGSVFIPALPLMSAKTQNNKLVEALYQLGKVSVYPAAGDNETISWVAAATLAVLGEFQFPPFRYIRSAGNSLMPGNSERQPLKVLLGELEIAEDKETVLIQTNIDDMNPQLMSYAIARFFDAGALDVYQVPIQMKKNRMGIQLNVTVRQRDEARLANMILTETSTLGVNVRTLDHRYHAEIRMVTVETKFGTLPVKQKYVNGVLIQSRPEYEAAAKIASTLMISMDEVYNEVVRQLGQK
jgi:uncharacterized protein (DUF111 family)